VVFVSEILEEYLKRGVHCGYYILVLYLFFNKLPWFVSELHEKDKKDFKESFVFFVTCSSDPNLAGYYYYYEISGYCIFREIHDNTTRVRIPYTSYSERVSTKATQ
jgi:hypothetical protein